MINVTSYNAYEILKPGNISDKDLNFNVLVDVIDPDINEILRVFDSLCISAEAAEWYVKTSLKSSIITESRRFETVRSSLISIPNKSKQNSAEQIHYF
jgi:hypothetical protein